MLMTETIFTLLCMIVGYYAVVKHHWRFFDFVFFSVIIGWGILIKPHFIFIASVFLWVK